MTLCHKSQMEDLKQVDTVMEYIEAAQRFEENNVV